MDDARLVAIFIVAASPFEVTWFTIRQIKRISLYVRLDGLKNDNCIQKKGGFAKISQECTVKFFYMTIFCF